MTDPATPVEAPGLRARIASLRYPWPDHFGTREANGWNEAFETIDRTLAAVPSESDGLDVERLAAAMLVAFGDLVGTVNETPREVWRKRAVILAREYAALNPSERRGR